MLIKYKELSKIKALNIPIIGLSFGSPYLPEYNNLDAYIASYGYGSISLNSLPESTSEWVKSLQGNFVGSAILAEKAIPFLKDRPDPNIIFILNGGIESLERALNLSKEFDGVMVGRLIQKNPFCLSKVDELFFNSSQKVFVNENTIHQYFKYIRPKLGKDSIFRLLSPLLQIFFGIPHSKEFKSKIHYNMKKNKIDTLENLILEFVN